MVFDEQPKFLSRPYINPLMGPVRATAISTPCGAYKMSCHSALTHYQINNYKVNSPMSGAHFHLLLVERG